MPNDGLHWHAGAIFLLWPTQAKSKNSVVCSLKLDEYYLNTMR